MELEDARNQLSKRTKQPTTTNTPTITINKLTDITQIHVTTRANQPTKTPNAQTPIAQPPPAQPLQTTTKAVKQLLKRRQYAQKLQGILKKTTHVVQKST
jgi:hypothetical protein